MGDVADTVIGELFGAGVEGVAVDAPVAVIMAADGGRAGDGAEGVAFDPAPGLVGEGVEQGGESTGWALGVGELAGASGRVITVTDGEAGGVGHRRHAPADGIIGIADAQVAAGLGGADAVGLGL